MRTTDERRVDASRLSELLGVEVSTVEVLDETSGSANRLRLRVHYQQDQPHLPERMFMKRHLADFNFPAEMYSTEVRIYRDVLPHTTIDQPAVYAIDSAPGDAEFTILMEDLSVRKDARVGFVLDPTTPDEVDGLLETLAVLHSTWWGAERLSRELPWLTTPTVNAPMRFWADVGPRLTRRHLRHGHRAELVDGTRWPEDQWWPSFTRLVAADETGPHTLLHGDAHASNVYYRDGGPGGLLDWQLALRGCWALDVTYLMITALSAADRRANEAGLLRGYLDRLNAAGVTPPTFEEAWLRYRQNVLYGVLMWLITPDGVHTDDAQRCFLQRCLTAAEDLETMPALAGGQLI
jgi:aminoglycoside phosphotransferase (APT) family kinase protein